MGDMTKSALLLALALSLAGCCQEAEHLTITGGEGPPGSDEVIDVARERCGRDLVGKVEWVTESRDGRHQGYCLFDVCGMNAWVVWWPGLSSEDGGNATDGELAHEIGHFCLQREDDDAVEAWACSVNDEVLRRRASG